MHVLLHVIYTEALFKKEPFSLKVCFRPQAHSGAICRLLCVDPTRVFEQASNMLPKLPQNPQYFIHIGLGMFG